MLAKCWAVSQAVAMQLLLIGQALTCVCSSNHEADAASCRPRSSMGMGTQIELLSNLSCLTATSLLLNAALIALHSSRAVCADLRSIQVVTGCMSAGVAETVVPRRLLLGLQQHPAMRMSPAGIDSEQRLYTGSLV